MQSLWVNGSEEVGGKEILCVRIGCCCRCIVTSNDESRECLLPILASHRLTQVFRWSDVVVIDGEKIGPGQVLEEVVNVSQ